jgi:hypothetical protein
MQIIKQKTRSPNLTTILMIENTLKKNRDLPMTLPQLKSKLPKQVMHQTLKVILEYLFNSGKIIYGPKGIQWIFSKPEHLQKMLKNSAEI